MFKSIRLSGETEGLIFLLRSYYEETIPGLRFFKGHMITKAFEQTKHYTNEQWVEVARRKYSIPEQHCSHVATLSATTSKLNLRQDVVDGLQVMLARLPKAFDTSWVTAGFCVKLMVKAALLERGVI